MTEILKIGTVYRFAVTIQKQIRLLALPIKNIAKNTKSNDKNKNKKIVHFSGVKGPSNYEYTWQLQKNS